MKTPTFPFEVKNGNNTVTIYRREKNGYVEFRLGYYEDGQRKLKSFASFDDAKKQADAKVLAWATGDVAALHLTGEQRREYVDAAGHLKKFGVRVDTAARRFAFYLGQMGGDHFDQAITEYVRRRDTIKEASVPEIVALFIEQKTKRTKRGMAASADYVKDLESRLGRFAEDFKMPIGSLTTDNVEHFLENLGSGGRTRFNYARLLRTLFRFAQAKKYLAKDVDLMEGIDVEHTDTSEIEIFTPEELARLLSSARKEFIPFLAIGAFAGLRHAEIKRLDWADIDLARGHIVVEAGKAKTGSRRIVPIQPNLKAWLTDHEKTSGPVVPFANCAKQLLWLVDDTNDAAPDDKPLKWKHNALRHSFVSYRFAILKSADQVAAEAGNSPQMIFGHYRELVTPEQAKGWFALFPTVEANIIPMAAEA
jgi:integrase